MFKCQLIIWALLLIYAAKARMEDTEEQDNDSFLQIYDEREDLEKYKTYLEQVNRQVLDMTSELQ